MCRTSCFAIKRCRQLQWWRTQQQLISQKNSNTPLKMTAELCVWDSVSKSCHTLMSSSRWSSPEVFRYLTQKAKPTRRLTKIANTTPTPMPQDAPILWVYAGLLSETRSKSSRSSQIFTDLFLINKIHYWRTFGLVRNCLPNSQSLPCP